MARIVGTSIENLLKQNFRHIESWRRFGLLEVAERALTSGTEQRNDIHLLSTYGNDVYLDCLFLPFMYSGEQHLMVMAMDITDRKQVEYALMQEKAFLRALIDAASDYIYFKDRNGFYLGCNKSSQNLIGLSEQEQIGKSDIDIFSKEEAEHILKKDQEILKSGVAIRIEEWVSSSTVGRVLLETTKAPIFDNHGQPIGLVGISRDITERKQMEEDLLQAKADAESANRAKSVFLANMSHELRNPMNGILGMTQLLEMTEPTEDQREYVAALKLSGKNLLSLINDILDLSKIEAGKITIEPVEFSLRHCFNDVALMQKSVIFAKGLTLASEVSEDIPQFMMGDQLRVKQILHNLMGNAVKFTSQGGIIISAQLLERQDSSLLVELAVRDSGIGISPEALDKIFIPFEQEDGSITRTYGGTGLGLTISRSLTELMGGSITVASTSGEGSCFKVTLPFTAVEERVAPHEIPQKANASWDGPPLRILLVENDQVNILFGTALLRKLGHEVIVAADGRECLTVLEKGGLDIVLMDINMPDMNGEEALREIRRIELETHLHQKVIALTAYSLRGDKERFLDEGFDGYVSKPMAVSELMLEMKRVVGAVKIKGAGNHE
ncbi:MAG TPA: PAS domain S-box protein [Desulfuromonadales bacterium]|nr:PAS domain S-box protein [Desulfuromonadales bacterium]